MAIKRLAVVAIGLSLLLIPSFFWMSGEGNSTRVGNRYMALCEELSKTPPPWNNSGAFLDVTDQLGLHFMHRPGPLGTYYFPEVNGAGGALFDFDNDGDLDVFLIQSGRSPLGIGDMPRGIQASSRLFRQESGGAFTDVTKASGIDIRGYPVGCATADIDNDGDLDLYVTDYGPDHVLQNNGDSTFTDITSAVGLAEKGWTTGVTFLDYDRDGWLDVFVSSYVEDSLYDHSVGCRYGPELVTYCGPRKFTPTASRLFHNEGTSDTANSASRRRFVDVSERAGIRSTVGAGFSAVSADFNRDGWADIYVAHDTFPNQLWINAANGTFAERAVLHGLSVNGSGVAQGSMGLAIGDVDSNGAWDVLVSNFSTESCTLYSGDDNGFFTDRTQLAQLASVTQPHTGWGVALLDLDHDGDLDLPIANGLVTPCDGLLQTATQRLEQMREKVDDPAAYWSRYADRNLLLINDGQGHFLNATSGGGDFTARLASARALLHGDVDNDGDVDLLITYCGGAAKLYRNELPKQGHWLMCRVVDPRLRRDAYGAEVDVVVGSRRWRNLVNPSNSYLASNDPRLHFGLGAADHYDSVVVRWPDGLEESFSGGPADRLVQLNRGEGHTENKR